MIVPMNKVSLIVLESEKKEALKKLRRLGVLHIEITEGAGEHFAKLKEDLSYLENAASYLAEYADKNVKQATESTDTALGIADKIFALTREKEALTLATKELRAELDRLRDWGEIDPGALDALAQKGIPLSVYEMSGAEYRALDASLETVVLFKSKKTVRFLLRAADIPNALKPYRVHMPAKSTAEQRKELEAQERRICEINDALRACAEYQDILQKACLAKQKDIEFALYESGMDSESLSENAGYAVRIAHFVGYLPKDDTNRLRALSKENAWGLVIEEPTADDNVPTKLKNNKFVSLIYPLTDFLGTVPGYFEYDISAWFLGFILVFFGIIFGDGGYGLLICAVAGLLIWKTKAAKKRVPDAYLLILLMGGATVFWGILTCTWFGISPDLLPVWLQRLSVPVISNVYADKLWHPFWTSGEIGLTTTQNLQILCFTLALVQLSLAHVMALVRNRKSLKLLGDIGSILQLIGIYYVVLSLVVNSQVFTLDLVISGFPVGMAAIALVGIGFVMSFVFSNYEGKLGASILNSLKNIVSALLGVVNVFSDIVSYIRLWAVGLAGAAISATVNELASPFLGNFMLLVFAIILLVFGHGLNMILNVLSVIVHGVRLNTLEFSTHLDMSWSGHKFKPFEE